MACGTKLKSPEEIEGEIKKQVDSCAAILNPAGPPGLPGFGPEGAGRQDQRRGRTARQEPPALLEAALSEELIPAKRDIVRDNTESEFGEKIAASGVCSNRGSPACANSSPNSTSCVARTRRRRIHDGQGAGRKDEFEVGLQRATTPCAASFDADQPTVRPSRVDAVNG